MNTSNDERKKNFGCVLIFSIIHSDTYIHCTHLQLWTTAVCAHKIYITKQYHASNAFARFHCIQILNLHPKYYQPNIQSLRVWSLNHIKISTYFSCFWFHALTRSVFDWIMEKKQQRGRCAVELLRCQHFAIGNFAKTISISVQRNS